MDLAVGIDIGGTKTKIGLVNREGVCLIHSYFRTREYEDFNEFLNRIKSEIDKQVENCQHDVNLIGCGIGAPNASSKNGTLEHAANLRWKGIVPILSLLNQKINLPLRIMNDASAAALGEMLFGNAKNMTDFIVITLGTGLGAGIVANGQLIEGFDGFAGELGHTDMTIGDGRMTGLNVRGGLEAYVSATGLKRTILYMMSKYMEDSRFRGIAYNNLHGEDITKAAEEGDFIALKAFDYTANIFGMALANFTAFTQPEAIFLMGGLVNSGKLFLEPLEAYFEEYLIEVYKGKVKLLHSGLPEKTPAISGAAALIWQNHK